MSNKEIVGLNHSERVGGSLFVRQVDSPATENGPDGGRKANIIKKAIHPRNYWNKETIEEAARAFCELNGGLSHNLLTQKGRSTFGKIIQERYPGRIWALREAIEKDDPQKPKGFWTQEQIEQDAQLFYQEKGVITESALRENGRADLVGAIAKHYPGRLTILKRKIGAPSKFKPKGYWKNPETIESEAVAFLEEHGDINSRLLKENGRGVLCTVIYGLYPGKMRALKAKLGITAKERVISPEEAREELGKLLEW